MPNPYQPPEGASNSQDGQLAERGWSKNQAAVVWAVAITLQCVAFAATSFLTYIVQKTAEWELVGFSASPLVSSMAVLLLNSGSVVAIIAILKCNELNAGSKAVRTFCTLALGFAIWSVFATFMHAAFHYMPIY